MTSTICKIYLKSANTVRTFLYILRAKDSQNPPSFSFNPSSKLAMAPTAIDLSDTFSQLSVSEDLVPSRAEQQSKVLTLNFKGLLNPPLRLQTDVSECGGQLWPAGMVLAEYLLRNKMEELRGKTMFVRSKDFLLAQGEAFKTSTTRTYTNSICTTDLSSVPAVGSQGPSTYPTSPPPTPADPREPDSQYPSASPPPQI